MCVALILSACRTGNQPTSEVEGLYQSERLWSGARAVVCFSNDSPGSVEFRANVKKIIYREFNQRTVFQFSGFELCSKLPRANIEVKVLGDGRSFSSIGNTMGRERKILSHFFPFLKERSPMFLYLNNSKGVPKDPVIMHNLIIHEFGHAAGLEHEHKRADNKNGVFCADEGDGIANPSPGNIHLGEFDINSVMNYCRPDFYSQEISLSQGDIDTIAMAYAAHRKRSKPQKPILRCENESFKKCALGHGGVACLADFCGAGKYICESREKLATCLQNKGGSACLGPTAGNCK